MGRKIINMTGLKCGRWTVVSKAEHPVGGRKYGKYWNCICECGNKGVVDGVSLRNGDSKSCGCLKSELTSIRMKEARLKKAGSLRDRFFSRFVKLDNGCWQWRAHADKDGYGVMSTYGKNRS